jgi:DNA replication protein DnaC
MADVLDRLARARRERAAGRRVREAAFRELHTLESFDWSFNAKAINRRQIEQLVSCDFIRRRDNLLVIGQSGVGKSHIVQAIGHAACQLGFRVRYTTSASLIAQLHASLADGTLPSKLRRLQKLDLLIVDEFGFDRVERTDCPHAASLLYKAIDERHGKRSTALVSNVDFAKWNDYMQDAPISMAFTDRLIDRATVLKINGRSYRASRRRSKS